MSDPADASRPTTRVILGRFRVEKTLGRGGMGEVLLAYDQRLHRRVALKHVHPGTKHGTRTGILREARRASRINDPGVAAIYDILEDGDEVVLVMEYVDGITLRERMSRPVSLAEFWSIATPCVNGVGAAHARGVIHRDIKPENLMVTAGGRIKILDFGIARRSAGSEETSTMQETGHPNAVMGTPLYMAPEAHFGRAVDERTDIFSLGVVFYELLTERRPFQGATYAAVVDQMMNTTPPPISELRPEAGPELSAIVGRMLGREPADRFASTDELLRQLEEARKPAGELSNARSPGGERARAQPIPAASEGLRSSRTWPALSRRGWSVALPAIAFVVAGLGIWRWVPFPAFLPAQRHVAVVAPSTPAPDDEFACFALGATELLHARLRRHVDAPGFQLASFQEGLDGGVRTPADARSILGANLALLTMFEPSPDRLRARLELHDTRGRTLATRRIEVPATDPFGFLERTYRAAAEMLRLPRRAGDPASEYGLRGAGTLRFHLQALGRLRMAKSEADARAAADEFERACMAEPRAAVPWAGLSAAQIKAFTFSEDSTWLSRAEGSARKAVEMDPSRPEAHRVLGHVFATEKRQEDARMEFARASDLDPTDDVLRYQLGRTYFRLGQPEEEKEIYLATQRRRPHDAQPAWWIAAWEYRAGHVEESIRRYRQMIRLAPLSEKAYASLGGLLVLHGDYDAAADTLKLAIALRPTMAAFSNLGTAYFNSGRFRESADAYNQSLQFGEPDDQTWLNVGDAYFWLEGREAEARRAYAEAIRLGREEMARRTREGRSFNVLIPARLATIYSRLGQRDSAQLYLDRALRADSSNSMVQYQAALTRWQLGDREAALAWLEKSVQGGYPTVWLRDSPMFREWRERPEFRALAEPANLEPPQAASRN